MKIALIDPALFTWPYDKALADGLRSAGLDVTLYTKYLAKGEPGQGNAVVRQLFYPGLQLSLFSKLPRPLFLALKGLMHGMDMIQLLVLLALKKPDVIHFQWTPLAVIDRWFIPLFRKIAPTVLTVHDSSPFNNNPGASLQRVGAISIMASFDRLIVHTAHARARLIEYGMDERKIALIPHGPLDNQMAALPAGGIGLPERATPEVSLLLFGKLKPYKGGDLLIRALAQLPADLQQRTRLRIVGKAEMPVEPLQQLAEELKVAHLIDWQLRFVSEEEMPAIFQQADIMVMPYREIDASGVLMVALTIGRPIIASRIGLFAELLEDGTHGHLVPPEDPAALAEALAKLIADEPKRRQMADAVNALARAIPNWPEIGQMTRKLYETARS